MGGERGGRERGGGGGMEARKGERGRGRGEVRCG